MMSRGFTVLLCAAFALSACHGATSPSMPAAYYSSPSGASACEPRRYPMPDAPAYAHTIWPSEKHDEWRTGAVAGGLPKGFHRLSATNAKLPPVPVWGYVGLDGDLYVTGGQPYLLDIYTKLIMGSRQSEKSLLAESLAYSEKVTPYVAKIDPATLKTQLLMLPRKHGVNYIGGMIVHSNGYLYAVARGVLYKIDPSTFSIVAWKLLPWVRDSKGQRNPLTSYNGMQATDDGDLILKGFASFGGGPGILVRVDPTDLSIKARSESQAIAGARLVVATSGNRQFVYTAGAVDSIRFLVKPHSFALDDAFSQQYLDTTNGSTEGTSEAFMGNGVVFTDNTTPDAKTPMTIFAQAADDGSTLSSESAFDSAEKGWNWEMPAGDPYRSGIAAIQDQLSGHVAGFRVCNGGAATQKLWENDRIADSVGLSINVRDGQLYADDRHCVKKVCNLALVVLDLASGKELGRVAIGGTEPSIGQIFVGPKNAIFHLSTDTNRSSGYITRITAQ